MKIVKKIECSHKENRMENEGNILKAREYFFSKKNKNLYFLLKNRYEWINKFVNKLDNTIELGSGACFLKKFVTNNNIKTSDLSNYEFLDYKKIDATNTNFPDNEFDKVISSNLIHHIAYPIKHFEEVYRILKPGGRYATSGAIAGPMVSLDVRTLYLKDLTFYGCTYQPVEVFRNLIRYIEKGEIKPLVSKTYPLEKIKQAQEEFLAKKHVGKLVLIPSLKD